MASKMYKIVDQYHGTAGKEYIDILTSKYSQNDYALLKEKLEKIQEKMEKEGKNDIMSYISAVSVVVLADTIVSEELFGESKDKSIEMGLEILEKLSNDKEIDIVDKCYDYIKSWLISNHKSFDKYKEPSQLENPRLEPEEDLVESSSNTKSFGLYDKNTYYVHRAVLEDKLKSKGYNYLKIVKEFAKRGYTIATRDENGNILENTIQKKFRGKNARMFAFPIEPIEKPLTEEEREQLKEEQQYKLLGISKENIENYNKGMDLANIENNEK